MSAAIDRQPRRSPLQWLGSTARDWSSTEGERLIFIGKTMLAAFGALWLAYRLGLDSPATAFTTVFILALPSSGMVLEKAFYRLMGTIAGSVASLTLIALAPQQTALLFLGLALWVGLCTSGATMFRNQQSYSFVLAGYTALIITLPAIETPTNIFHVAITRVTEVSLGIICSALINEALLPRHQGTQVMRTVQNRYAKFIKFCHDVLEQKMAPADVELAQLQFAADVAALESGRAAAYFEAAHARTDSAALHAFNSAFMGTLTTFYTLHRLVHRLHRDAASIVAPLIEPLYAQLGAALTPDGGATALEEARTALRAPVAAARQQLHDSAASQTDQVDFDTAVELLDRFALAMEQFQARYHALTQNKREQLTEPQGYEAKTPPLLVLASGARAAIALLLLAGAWYYLAWPYAVNSILMAVVFCALASSSPNPNGMVRQVLIGFLVAWPLCYLTVFYGLVNATGYPMLVLAMLPLVVLGTYLATDPKRAGIGLGINLFAAQQVTPLNLLHLDPTAFLNNTSSMILGVALAFVTFAVILPRHTMGQKDHVASALWRETLGACVDNLRGLQHRFGTRVRDLLNQLKGAAGPVPDAAHRAVVRQALQLLELGQSVIALRELIAVSPQGQASAALQRCVLQIAAYLRSPTAAACQAAIDLILHAGPHVRHARLEAEPERLRRLNMALTDLHAIYTALLDQLPHTPEGPHRAT